MERQKQKEEGSVAAVLDVGKCLGACQPPSGLGLGDALQLPKKDLAN